MALRILMVDDEAAVRNVVKAALTPLGMEVVLSARGNEAVSLVAMAQFDAVLLDINMPGESGIETCRALRQVAPTISIIMLTVRDSEDDKVDALSADADDYITKPFAVRELVARIQAVVRRGQRPANPGSQLSIGEVSVCAERRMFFKRGEAIHLTKTEFEIVYLLMRHQGKPLTHKKILSAVWGPEYRDHVEYLRTFVRELRKKVEDDPGKPQYLLTEAYVGYRFRG